MSENKPLLTSSEYDAIIEQFDVANAQDPKNARDESGQEFPAELLYGRRMTAWLNQLYPHAGEALRLAARAQHIRRWDIPRDRFPMNRVGYHHWRAALFEHHAQTAGRIMDNLGCDAGLIEQVQSLLKKQHLKTNPDAQALEDAACLVFLQYELAPFAAGREEEKVLEILRKTWKKISSHAQSATRTAPLPPEARRLLEKAVNTSEIR